MPGDFVQIMKHKITNYPVALAEKNKTNQNTAIFVFHEAFAKIMTVDVNEMINDLNNIWEKIRQGLNHNNI